MNKRFWSRRIQEIEPYVPGEQPKDRRYVKLNTNENPYPPSPKVVAAIRNADLAALRLYPDPDCAGLRQALAEQHGLAPEQVFVGNGSDEVLAFSYLAFMDEQNPAVFPDITYSFYPVYGKFFRNHCRIIPVHEDFTMPLEDMMQDDGTVILTNPNAPTGIGLPLGDVRKLLEANRNHVVIVDEAYVDFGGESCVPLIDQYENLLVVQTFSKSRQLAGARLGLAMGNAKLIADLNRVKFSLNPYNINRLTLKAGQAALEDTAYFDRTRAAIVDTRAWTKQQLEQRGFAVLDSRSNFLFASTDRKDGETLYKKLKKNGILVRHFDAPRIQNWLRITIGTPEQMQTFMETLDKIMEE